MYKADLDAINTELGKVDWQSLNELCPEHDNGEEFAELIRLVTLQICSIYSPKKTEHSTATPRMSRNRRILHRKRRKLKSKVNCLKQVQPQSPKIQQLEDELSILAVRIRDVIEEDLRAKEQKAVECVKNNPRYFFSYAKQFSKLRSNIGPLKDKNGILHHHQVDMARLLQDQYSSMFSNPNNPDIRDTTNDLPRVSTSFDGFHFSEKDITDAIDEIDTHSSAPNEEIPARVIKACKHPLSKAFMLLWKDSYNFGYIPQCYKTQYITPIYKEKGSKLDPGSYRPISLTSHVIKIFERVLRKNLVTYLEGNSLLSGKQYGFRKGRSCLTQLLKHYDEILENYLNGTETDVIYLDYAKAFDKVDHALLLRKVRHFGIGGKVYDWIEQFLLGRKQTVVIDGHHSHSIPVRSGVPQGTVLGPILFLLYVNDLETSIHKSTSRSFADDTKITGCIKSTQDMDILQADLDNIIEWSKMNNMELHEKKFEFLCYQLPENKTISEALPFMNSYLKYTTPSGINIERTPLVRDLGVTLSDGLTWTHHISNMVKSARKNASWTLGVFSDRSKTVMLQLYKSLIRSRLEYCSPLWNPSDLQHIRSLEDVQRYYTRRISGMSTLSYWERLSVLKLQSLQRRRERYIIIYTWKIIMEMVPNDINLKFVQNKRLGTRAVVPSLNRTASKKALTSYDNSFAVKATQLWNILPASTKTFESLDKFKVSLSTYLDSFPDQPPVTGYSMINRNSLLDWATQSGGLQMM